MNRKQAEQNYSAAAKAFHTASSGTDLDAYLAAEAAFNTATKELVEMELKYPTAKEIRKQDEKLRLRNRGLDV